MVVLSYLTYISYKLKSTLITTHNLILINFFKKIGYFEKISCYKCKDTCKQYKYINNFLFLSIQK